MTSLNCQICNSITKSKYRNVLCCESCKAFFRRTYLKEEGIRCPFAGKCEIETNTRKFCRACRLQKCYTVFSMKSLKSDNAKENNCDLLGQPLPTPINLKENLEKSLKCDDVSIPHKIEIPPIPLEYQILLNHLIQMQLFKNNAFLLKQNFNYK